MRKIQAKFCKVLTENGFDPEKEYREYLDAQTKVVEAFVGLFSGGASDAHRQMSEGHAAAEHIGKRDGSP